MNNEPAGAPQGAPAETPARFANPLAALVPTLAVGAAALAVAPMIAAEQFGRRPGEEPGEEAGAAEAERDGADGVAAADESLRGDAPAEPIALDARRQSRRSGVKREKNRDDRAERRSERLASREERPRRRRAADGAAASEVDGEAPDRAEAAEATTLEAAPDTTASEPTPAPVDAAAIEAAPEQAAGAAAEGAPAAPESALAMVEQPTTLQRVTTGRGLLVAPIVDTAVQSPRTIDRLRTQKEQAEKAILSSPDVTAAVAPLVRHVNAVTEQLNEAQLTIGRLTAERDALRLRLIEETGSFADQIDRLIDADVRDVERRQQRLLKLEGRENGRTGDDEAADEPGPVKRVFQRAGFIIPDDAGEEEYRQAARKRQIFAIALLAAIGLGMWLYQQNGNSLDSFSRETLTLIPYLGAVVQVFFVAWILFRMIRIGGKGARWVFPQQNTRKRRR